MSAHAHYISVNMWKLLNKANFWKHHASFQHPVTTYIKSALFKYNISPSWYYQFVNGKHCPLWHGFASLFVSMMQILQKHVNPMGSWCNQ